MQVIKKIFHGIIYCFRDITEDNWAYKLVALVGLILRVGLLPYILPDPFELLANAILSKFLIPKWLYQVLLHIALFLIDSLALSRIFYLVSYVSVGNMYESGDLAPWWGSLCYTIYYFGYFACICILIQFFYWWVILVVFCSYLIISSVLYIISGRLDVLPDNWILRMILHIVAFLIILGLAITLYMFI